jgi:hypothetical protein
MTTTTQRRPFRVQFKNAINGNIEGFRFRTESAALDYAKNPANWIFNNTAIRVSHDTRDGRPVREIWTSLWADDITNW